MFDPEKTGNICSINCLPAVHAIEFQFLFSTESAHYLRLNFQNFLWVTVHGIKYLEGGEINGFGQQRNIETINAYSTTFRIRKKSLSFPGFQIPQQIKLLLSIIVTVLIMYFISYFFCPLPGDLFTSKVGKLPIFVQSQLW